MNSNPIIAFGLKATATALHAKTGNLTLAARNDLLRAACALAGERPDIAQAVAQFENLALSNRAFEAGDALQEFVLEHIAPAAPVETIASPVLHEWQRRADCGF